MGTYHSFISQPLNQDDAFTLYNKVKQILDSSIYDNNSQNVRIVEIRTKFIIFGIIKNLGSSPVELNSLDTDFNWATVSDEADFYSSQ